MVFLDGSIPRCRACDSVPPLEELISQSANADPSLLIPPDQPFGEMRLRWPYCDLYSDESPMPDATAVSSPLEIQETSQPPENPQATSHGSQASFSETRSANREIYGDTLSLENFRLICLYSVENDDKDYPIHLTLEDFRHDDCPEYETVSYTWGGEDDDSTLCRPVYVGPYWDVLLQTRNCWNALLYLRPWRGVRMVWIDAVCINQSNADERSNQVSKMASIYRDALRVIVYLGDDVASTSSPAKTHRPRHLLQELDNKAPDPNAKFKALLERRYFSRVWVVQELTLSRLAIFPVRGMEFWTRGFSDGDIRDSARMSGLDLESTSASWIQHLGKGVVPGQKLWELLLDTRQSKSSDPRDKIFGVLGLISDKQGLDALTPDYGISVQHAFIGISVYLLLKQRNTNILRYAAGLWAAPFHPSWVPNWRGLSLMEENPVSDRPSRNSMMSPTLKQTVQSIHRHKFRDTRKVYFFPITKYPGPETRSDRGPGPECETFGEMRRQGSGHLWWKDVQVNSSTGTLSLGLIHLLQFDTSVHHCRTKCRISHICSSRARLCIETRDKMLDKRFPPGQIHLFYQHEGSLLLFMRYDTGLKGHKLVHCCTYENLYLEIYRPGPRLPSLSFDVNSSLHTVLTRALQKCQASSKVFERSVVSLPLVVEDGWFGIQQMFPGGRIAAKNILPVFQSIINESRHLGQTFLECYAQCLAEHLSEFEPKVDEHYLQLTFDVGNEPSTFWSYWKSSNRWDICWEWRRKLDVYPVWESCKLSSALGINQGVYQVRATVEDLKSYLKTTPICSALRSLTFFRDVTSEEEWEMLLRGPKEEDHLIPHRQWPRELIEDFSIDGVFQQVLIV